MPLGKNVGKNVKELYKDNQKSGKARGNKGKPRSRAQIIAIAESAAGNRKKTLRPHINRTFRKKMGLK